MSGRHDPLELHQSLRDPVLASIGFLNEVMQRHPRAISFAPGAPHPDFLRDFDVYKHVEHFLAQTGTDRQRLFEYGPARGLINDLIADALSTDQGLGVTGRDVVVTVGAQEAMLLVTRALLRAGERLAVADPCFPGIVGVGRILDVETVPIAEGEDGLDLGRLASSCEWARAQGRPIRACYVAPDYANPSGSRMSSAGRQALLDLAEQEDFRIIEDNVYGFTCAPEEYLPSLLAMDRTDRVIHIGTFAKIAAPGLRVGFVVAPQRTEPTGLLADHLAALKSMTTVNTPPLCQAAVGGLLLAHGTSLAQLGRDKGYRYRDNMRILSRSLERHLGDSRPGIRTIVPRGGFFARVTLPVAADMNLLEFSARDHGVLWTPMSLFHSGHDGDHTIRLSCSYLDQEEIEEGTTRLAAFIEWAIKQEGVTRETT